MYVSQKFTFKHIIHELDDLMTDTDDKCDTIMVGDFIMKSISAVN